MSERKHLVLALTGTVRIVDRRVLFDMGPEGCILLFQDVRGIERFAQQHAVALRPHMLEGQQATLALQFRDVPWPLEEGA